MRGRSAEELLQLPVRLHGIRLGRLVDAILDPRGGRIVGFDVLCGDGVHRFLPFAAAQLSEYELKVRSALMLLDDAELSFYRRRAATLRSLRGTPVERRGTVVGLLADVVVGDGAKLTELVVDTGRGTRRFPARDVTFGVAPSRESAA